MPPFFGVFRAFFSYLTAWSYFGTERPQCHVQVDAFTSKSTTAWDDLIPKSPTVFPHGDECNPYISCADIVAFLTDVKLYKARLHLRNETVPAVWTGYPISVSARYLDAHVESKICWYADEMIQTHPFFPRHMTFFLVDELSTVVPNTISPDIKFKQLVRETQAYSDVANWAYHQGGGFQGFDAVSDARRIREDDTLVYIGEKSKSFAMGLSHMMNLDILSAAELRDRMKTL